MTARLSRHVCRALALAAALVGMSHAPRASAVQVFTVDYGLDEVDDNPGNLSCHTATNHCTLRAAVMEATLVPNDDTVIVLPAGTYGLTIPAGAGGVGDGPLKVTQPAMGNPTLSILGAGAGATIINIGASLRGFTVSRPARFVGLTIRGGRSQLPLSGVAGAILNIGVGGVLTLDGCSLEDNKALGSTVSSGRGGAISNTGILTLERTNVSQNEAVALGGAIYNETNATLNVRNSTITNNYAQTVGGGIANLGTLSITQSTISTNQAGAQGGGIHNTGTSNVYNTTIAFNQADLSGGVAPGGGVFNSATFNLRNSVVAGNVRAIGPVNDDCGGSVAAYGNNAFFAIPAGCAVTQNGPGAVAQLGSLAEIGPLQDNGGSTRTHALVAPSALIDGGDPNFGCLNESAQTLVVDQRGFPRAAGVRCDLGAYENGAPGGQPQFVDGFEEPEAPPLLVINEVDYDQPGTDTGEFVEIRNNGTQSVKLAGLALVTVDGSNGNEDDRVDLGPAGSLPPGGFLVVRSPGVVVAPSALTLSFAGAIDRAQNGAPDGLALIQVSPPLLIDALSYEGSINAALIDGFAGTVDLVEGVALAPGVADSNSAAGSLCRYPDGTDNNQANVDWTFRSTPTPGLANQ